MENVIIPSFTKDEYLFTTNPYEWLYQFIDKPLQLKQMTALLSENAKDKGVGLRNFGSYFKAYIQQLKGDSGNVSVQYTDFDKQEIQLECSGWTADDYGVTSEDRFGFEIIACNHPIMPVQRLVNIDTGIEKLKISYKKGRAWRNIIVDKRTLASATSIIQLAEVGIAVNSENAKYLVKYFTDIEHMNYDLIPEVSSVGRLGWIGDSGFAPYVDDLIFDGEQSFKHFFDSVKEHGSFEKWLELAKEIRASGNIPARILLASSFSSVLVEPLGGLPFFVHLWGTTETGKTVALMLSASVWANPKMGEYIHTFNSTAVAQELSAGFVNSLPLILDELQIIKDRKDFDNLIYQLSEGVGRARGQKTGGLQRVQSWLNCFLTTGESPISNSSSGGGAVNRIIEIECNSDKIFADPRNVANILKRNYGFAGKIFIEKLQQDNNIEKATTIQNEFYTELAKSETTEKQAGSASIILTADKLIEEWFFKDGMQLSIDDIKPFLSTKNEVSNNIRAYGYLLDFIAINQNKFRGNSEFDSVWGMIGTDYIYIIKSKFDEIMSDGGFNGQSFLSWLKRENKIECDTKGKTTKTKRINGGVCRCVWLITPKEDDLEDGFNIEKLPF